MRRFALAFASITVVATARAEAPDLSLQLSTRKVGVGEPFQVTLQAATESGSRPTNPSLEGSPTLKAKSGPNLGTFMKAEGSFGRMVQKSGISATWVLVATKAGTVLVGPATVSVDGKVYKTPSYKVEVTKEKQGASPGVNPFGGLFPSPFDEEPETRAPKEEATDPALALEQPRDKVAFLHAVVDKKQAVVGEQVTVSVYMYRLVDAVGLQLFDAKDLKGDAFRRQNILEIDRNETFVGHARVAGDLYRVDLFTRAALFPLRAGTLPIEPFRISMRHHGKTLERVAEAVNILVKDPPAKGRPAGYLVGHTGSFNAKCESDKREVPTGSTVFASVTLDGRGSFPTEIRISSDNKLEWGNPDTKDAFNFDAAEHHGGTRTFSYVGKVLAPGTLKLGAFRFPYFDPARGSYLVAECDLGNVVVTGAPVLTKEEESRVTWPLPQALPAAEPIAASQSIPQRFPKGWLLAPSVPLAALVFAFAEQLGRKRRGTEPRVERLSAKALLRQAAETSDPVLQLSLLEKAIHERISSNGERHSEATRSNNTAALAALRAECQELRFAPGTPDAEKVSALIAQAKEQGPW